MIKIGGNRCLLALWFQITSVEAPWDETRYNLIGKEVLTAIDRQLETFMALPLLGMCVEVLGVRIVMQQRPKTFMEQLRQTLVLGDSKVMQQGEIASSKTRNVSLEEILLRVTYDKGTLISTLTHGSSMDRILLR